LRLATVGNAGAIAGSYSYRTDGRLATSTVDNVASIFDFDNLGNLRTATVGGLLTTYTYTGNCLATSTSSGVTTAYAWNPTFGWRTSQGPQGVSPAPISFTYTGTGRLASYTNTSASPAVSALYTYDAGGQRKQSVVTKGAVTTTTDWTYEGLDLLSLMSSESGGNSPTSWRITYLYDENKVPYAGIYRCPADSTSATVFGMVITTRGDVVELLDANGSPFAAYRYDAWGRPTNTQTMATSLISANVPGDIATRQVLRYASYCFDAESGLYYLSSRHYDPVTRQFISKDPGKTDGEESAYQYCGGDPVGSADATGEHGVTIIPTYQFVSVNGVMRHNWCWAASMQCVIRTLTGKSMSIVRIVRQATGSAADVGLRLIYKNDSKVTVANALPHFGVTVDEYDWPPPSWAQLDKDFSQGKLVVAGLMWRNHDTQGKWGLSLGGHMVVVHAAWKFPVLVSSRVVGVKNWVDYMDPAVKRSIETPMTSFLGNGVSYPWKWINALVCDGPAPRTMMQLDPGVWEMPLKHPLPGRR
jgi:RHS repeat-associated protein